MTDIPAWVVFVVFLLVLTVVMLIECSWGSEQRGRHP